MSNRNYCEEDLSTYESEHGKQTYMRPNLDRARNRRIGIYRGRLGATARQEKVLEKYPKLLKERRNARRWVIPRKPFRLMDLPVEIRQGIYGYILLFEEPFDFTPRGGRNYKSVPLARMDAIHEYSAHTKAALGLLRVSTQILSEAAPVFYGQEFRFSSHFGWIMLQYFMRTIGSRNVARLRSITVQQPFSRPREYDELYSKNGVFQLDRLLSMKMGFCSLGYPEYYPMYAAMRLVFRMLEMAGRLRTLRFVFGYDELYYFEDTSVSPEDMENYNAIVTASHPYTKQGRWERCYPIWAMIERLVRSNELLKIKFAHTHIAEAVDGEFLLETHSEQQAAEKLDTDNHRLVREEAQRRGWDLERFYFSELGRYPVTSEEAFQDEQLAQEWHKWSIRHSRGVLL